MPVLSPLPTDDIYVVIKSLLASRANSTLAELLDDYKNKVGDNRLPQNYTDLRRLLQSIPEVECFRNDYGLEMWEVKKHEYKYMKKNKSRGAVAKRPRATSKHPPPRDTSSKGRNSSKRSVSKTSSQGSSFTKSQPKSKRQRNHDDPSRQHYQRDINHNVSRSHRTIDLDGYFHNYQLMGDDFMLSMAKIDLGFKFTKDPETDVLRIGYCISGLSIKDLARIVRSSACIDSRVIVYVGSVDVLNGRSVEAITHDYHDLVSAFRERGIEPILCTLAPFGDDTGSQFDGIINGFNCWLQNRKWRVIDIYECFVDGNKKIIRSVYQKDPRKVSGCNVRHLLWNMLGRQRVLKAMKNFTLGTTFNL